MLRFLVVVGMCLVAVPFVGACNPVSTFAVNAYTPVRAPVVSSVVYASYVPFQVQQVQLVQPQVQMVQAPVQVQVQDPVQVVQPQLQVIQSQVQVPYVANRFVGVAVNNGYGFNRFVVRNRGFNSVVVNHGVGVNQVVVNNGLGVNRVVVRNAGFIRNRAIIRQGLRVNKTVTRVRSR